MNNEADSSSRSEQDSGKAMQAMMGVLSQFKRRQAEAKEQMEYHSKNYDYADAASWKQQEACWSFAIAIVKSGIADALPAVAERAAARNTELTGSSPVE